MAIIVFQHSDGGRPGRLGMTLRDHAHRLDIRRTDLGDPVPNDLDGIEGVVVLGGPQNVGDNFDWMRAEEAFLKEAHCGGVPIVGICLGSQMIANALGGEVGRMKRPVVGFRRISINPGGQVDPLLAGVAWDSMQFCTHGACVSAPPPDGQILAGSEHCGCQIFRAGIRTYGFQFHFEADRTLINSLLDESPELLENAGVSNSDVDSETGEHYPGFARLGDRLSVNIATFLMPSHSRVGV